MLLQSLGMQRETAKSNMARDYATRRAVRLTATMETSPLFSDMCMYTCYISVIYLDVGLGNLIKYFAIINRRLHLSNGAHRDDKMPLKILSNKLLIENS